MTQRSEQPSNDALVLKLEALAPLYEHDVLLEAAAEISRLNAEVENLTKENSLAVRLTEYLNGQYTSCEKKIEALQARYAELVEKCKQICDDRCQFANRETPYAKGYREACGDIEKDIRNLAAEKGSA